MNHVNRKTSVNIFGRMDHVPIIERIAIASNLVTKIKPHYMTRWVEAHITAIDDVG